MKPDEVTIIQVVVQGTGLVGLGDDGQIYRWIGTERKWAL